MSSLDIEKFIKHITTSKKLREQFTADVILDFYYYCHLNNSSYRFSHIDNSYEFGDINNLIREIPKLQNFSDDFKNALLDEYKFLMDKIDEEQMIDRFICEYNLYYEYDIEKRHYNSESILLRCLDKNKNSISNIINYIINYENLNQEKIINNQQLYNKVPIHSTLQLIMNKYNHLLGDYRPYSINFNKKVCEIWDLLTDEEKSVWKKSPEIYCLLLRAKIRWETLYSYLVREAYPNINNCEFNRIMNILWDTVNKELNYADLIKYNIKYTYSYIEYTDDEKNKARRYNDFIMFQCLPNKMFNNPNKMFNNHRNSSANTE